MTDPIVIPAEQSCVQPIKVLALHGWRTSASILKFQMRDLPKQAEYYVPDAFHPASGPPQQIVAKFFSEPYYEWYDSVDGKYEGLEDSLKYIEQLDKQHGPFHGVLGFSQGACLAATLCAMTCNDRATSPLPHLKFGMLISGMLPRDSSLLPLFDKPLSLPMFGCFGQSDFLKESAEALYRHFGNITVTKHSGAHELPTKANGEEALKKLKEFMAQFDEAVER